MGKQRDLNEDSLLAMTMTMAGNSGNLPFGLYIIADGMGGHQFGEVASNAAIRTVAGYVLRKFHPYLFHGRRYDGGILSGDHAGRGDRCANVPFSAKRPGSGTTLNSCAGSWSAVTVAHVGDSRALFFIPDGRIEPLRRDHSLVKTAGGTGHITSDEAATTLIVTCYIARWVR